MAKKKEAPARFETLEEYQARVDAAVKAAGGNRRIRPPAPLPVGPAEVKKVDYTDPGSRRSGTKVIRTVRFSNGTSKTELISQVRNNRPKTVQTELDRLKEKVAELEARGVG